jgi:hypothetical protein
MLVHGSDLYLVDGAGRRRLVAQPTDGGDASTLLREQDASLLSLTNDSQYIYWQNASVEQSIVRAGFDGEHVTTLATGLGTMSGGPAVDDDYVFTQNSNSVVKTPRAGGAIIPVAITSGWSAGGVLVDSKNVYWFGLEKVYFHSK